MYNQDVKDPFVHLRLLVQEQELVPDQLFLLDLKVFPFYFSDHCIFQKRSRINLSSLKRWLLLIFPS